MRRILFLDIDGVLNNRESMMRTDVSIFRVDKACSLRLRNLVNELGIKLVLSSTWRKGGGANGRSDGVWRARDAINEACGWAPLFIGFTPDLSSQRDPSGLWLGRGEECNEWIRHYGQSGDVYAAVDDDCDFDAFVGTLIRTNHEPGLTDADCDKIRQVFSR